MYLTYVDESGDTGLKGSRHLLLGAAVLFEGRWAYVRNDIANLLSAYFPVPPLPREIHCAEVRRGRNVYKTLAPSQRETLLTDFCQIASAMLDVELRMLTVIYDKEYWYRCNPGRTGDDLYVEAFENLVSRVDLFLRRRHAQGAPSKTITIVDPHSSAMCTALKRAQESFQLAGTRWGDIHNVIESAMFLNSHESPGLQLADLCSYAVWRLVEQADASLIQHLACVFDREPLTSTTNPGKWHGVKYFGHDSAVSARLRQYWP